MLWIRHLLAIGVLLHQAVAFIPSDAAGNPVRTPGSFDQVLGSCYGCGDIESPVDAKPAVTTRKSFVEDTLRACVGLSIVSTMPLPVYASGGATAGGAYLLSGENNICSFSYVTYCPCHPTMWY